MSVQSVNLRTSLLPSNRSNVTRMFCKPYPKNNGIFVSKQNLPNFRRHLECNPCTFSEKADTSLQSFKIYY